MGQVDEDSLFAEAGSFGSHVYGMLRGRWMRRRGSKIESQSTSSA